MSTDIDTLRPELAAGLEALGLPAALAAPLLGYLALLARWNATYNLTAIRDPRDMVAKHLLDSLAMQPFVPRRCGPLRARRRLGWRRAGPAAGDRHARGWRVVLVESESARRSRFLTRGRAHRAGAGQRPGRARAARIEDVAPGHAVRRRDLARALADAAE
jgi:16S rRNA (guanine527-N7)-methyltransferase